MKVNFTGDIGIFRSFERLGKDPFRETELPGADLNIGNFEFIIHKNRPKFFYDVQDHYSCSYNYFESLDAGKFGGLGLANNHCLDYGSEGVSDTLELLNRKGVRAFGYGSRQGYHAGEFEIDGIRVCIIACVKAGRWSRGKHGFGPDPYDADAILNEIPECKKLCDHVIIYPHWGTELLEIPDQDDVINARKFIDAGASAVIGHHPHICQGIEKYGNGLIAYSLGSFIYIPEDELGYRGGNENRNISVVLNVDFSKDSIRGYTAYYYRYDPASKLPGLRSPGEVSEYASFLNSNIHNREAYNKQLKSVLLKREFHSFLQRFRKNPLATLVNYLKLLNPRNLKKLFSS
jgi:hypothetical protein